MRFLQIISGRNCYPDTTLLTTLITSRRIIFTPAVDLKDEQAGTAIQITCFDRNGEEVKRVTSADDGTVEDNDDENGSTNTGENTGGNTGGNGGDNNGGGGNNNGGVSND